MIWINATAWYNGADNPQSTLTIVETQAMRQVLEANATAEKQASSLATALKDLGRVAVYGIAFDFNKASDAAPEATPVLDQVKALLVKTLLVAHGIGRRQRGRRPIQRTAGWSWRAPEGGFHAVTQPTIL